MAFRYIEIAESIKDDILKSKLKPGEKVPSVRHICNTYKCSISSAMKALKELEANKVIYSVPGSGHYVIEGKNHVKNKGIEEKFDFMSGNMNIQVLPISEFRDCVDKAIEIYKEQLFLYSNPLGSLSLRSTLSRFLEDYQIFAKPESIAVVSGSQQALDIISRMKFPNNKKNILLEQPTYHCMGKILALNHLNSAGIERRQEGVDMNMLEDIFKTGEIKFFYTIPRFHQPTGFFYNNKQKKDILRLAEKYNVYIVEDDHLADLELNSRNLPIKFYDTNSRVIYIRSFSKALFPGMRVGVVVLPYDLVDSFREYKYNTDVYTSLLSQGALEVYLQSGMHHSHMKNIKKYYHKKMTLLKEIWDGFDIHDIKAFIPDTGFYAWFEMPAHFSAEKLKNNLRQRNVFIDDGSIYYLDGFRKPNYMVLCMANIDINRMRAGLSIIKDEIMKLKKQSIRL